MHLRKGSSTGLLTAFLLTALFNSLAPGLQASTTPPLPTKLPGSSTPTLQPLTTPASTTSATPASTSKAPETTPAQTTVPPASTSIPVSSTLPPQTTPCVKKTGSPNIFLPADPTGFYYFSSNPKNGDLDTIGQTFTPTADSTITSFSFDLRILGGNSPDFIFAAYLYAWDAIRPGPIEPQLFAAAPTSVPTDGAAVTFNVPGCLTLSASTQYVAFLSSAGYWLAGGTELIDNVLPSTTSPLPNENIVLTHAGNYTANFTTTALWYYPPQLENIPNLAFNVTYA